MNVHFGQIHLVKRPVNHLRRPPTETAWTVAQQIKAREQEIYGDQVAIMGLKTLGYADSVTQDIPLAVLTDDHADLYLRGRQGDQNAYFQLSLAMRNAFDADKSGQPTP